MPSIFLSSTFKDLQDERNFFSYKIGAEINKFTLKNYGENYYFRDLRLGVENIEEDFQTINACLYYLKNDAPPNPYVAIIGDNLGWVPKKETIEDAINNLSDEDGDLKKVLNDVLEESSGKSITNIEIDYAAFGKGDPENSEKYKKRTLFIFKSKEEHGDPSLKRLKDDIKKEFPDSIIYMDDYENPLENKKFKNVVLKKMKTIIKKANNRKLSKAAKERKIHENYMELKAKGFYGRTEVIKEIKSSIEKNDGYTYIYGESGIGKSSLVSRIVKDYKESNQFDVFPIYCGLTPDSDSAFNLITAITNYLKQFLSDEQKETVTKASESNDILEIYKSVCYSYNEDPETKSVLIVIDAIDQLKPDEFKDECAFLSYNGHEKIHFLFSGTESGDYIKKSYKGFRELDKNQNFYLHEIKGIDETEKEALLKSIFANELDKGQLLNAVVKKVAEYKISSPLYLKLIALRIANLTPTEMKELGSTGGHRSEKYVEIVDRFLNPIVKTENEGDKQLETLVKAFFKSICEGKNDLYSVLQYIALSRHGLPESVIKAIDKDFDMSQFELLQYNLRGVFFEHNDGCIDFTHKVFRNTLRKQIENEKEYHEAIFEVLEVLKYEKTYIDFVKTEYAYHAFFSGGERELNDYIKENTPRKKDLEEDRKIKEERLDYVAATLVRFDFNELFNTQSRLINYKTFVDFLFEKVKDKYTLSLMDTKRCHNMMSQICFGYNIKLSKQYRGISRMSDVCQIDSVMDAKIANKLFTFLNDCLYYFQKVQIFKSFFVLRMHQISLKVELINEALDLWKEISENCNFYNFFDEYIVPGFYGSYESYVSEIFSETSVDKREFDYFFAQFIETQRHLNMEKFFLLDETVSVELKEKIVSVIFKILCLIFQLSDWFSGQRSWEKCFCIEEYKKLKASISIEKCPAEELAIYYNDFVDDIFDDFIEPQNLIKEYDFALNFLENYIDYYDYHYATISAIKKIFDSIIKNKVRGKLNCKYICEKYISVAEFFVKHYQRNDVLFDESKKVVVLYDGIPDCFENESDLKRKWAELSYKFIKRTYVDFSHSYSQAPADPINKLAEDLSFLEKNVNLFKQEGYEDLVGKLSKCAIKIINEFFCYYEERSFYTKPVEERKILSSLNNGDMGKLLNFSTIYESLSEKDKKHIRKSFNSLLQYKEEYQEKNRNNGYGIKWDWKRPAPES